MAPEIQKAFVFFKYFRELLHFLGKINLIVKGRFCCFSGKVKQVVKSLKVHCFVPVTFFNVLLHPESAESVVSLQSQHVRFIHPIPANRKVAGTKRVLCTRSIITFSGSRIILNIGVMSPGTNVPPVAHVIFPVFVILTLLQEIFSSVTAIISHVAQTVFSSHNI